MSQQRRRTAAAALLFLLVVAGLFYRASRHGLELRDFRDGLYYAVVAVLEGANPYDAPRYMSRYPVEQAYSPYMPGFLLLHLPLALLRFESAQVVYFLTMVVLATTLVTLSLRIAAVRIDAARCLALSSFLLLSRPGSWSLGLGQFSLQFAIGTVVALAYAQRRPAVAAAGLAVALLKPTYGAPLVILLAATERWRVLAGGMLSAAALSVPPLAALLAAEGGVAAFASALAANWATFSADPGAAAATGPERVDVVSVAGRFLGYDPPLWVELVLTAGVAGAGSMVYRRMTRDAGADLSPLAFTVALLALLLCTYHQTYDLVVLIAPLTLLTAGLTSARAPILQALLIALLLLPMLNYLSPQAVQNRLGTTGWLRDLLARLNALALLAAFALALILARRRSPRSGDRR